MSLFDWVFDLVYPKFCLSCGKWGRYFCDRCRDKLRPILTNETICPVCQKGAVSGLTHFRCQGTGCLDGLTSLFHYSGPMKQAIHDFKYRGVTDLVGELTEIIKLASSGSQSVLTQVLAGLGDSKRQLYNKTSYNFDGKQGRAAMQIICIPIPLHSRKLRERGFNQAELIARLFASQFGWSVCTDILVRSRATTPQVEMKKRQERLVNMHGVFAVKLGVKLPPDLGIVLVDDVYTTGATLSAAAKTLKAAGAPWVWAMTLAR